MARLRRRLPARPAEPSGVAGSVTELVGAGPLAGLDGGSVELADLVGCRGADPAVSVAAWRVMQRQQVPPLDPVDVVAALVAGETERPLRLAAAA